MVCWRDFSMQWTHIMRSFILFPRFGLEENPRAECCWTLGRVRFWPKRWGHLVYSCLSLHISSFSFAALFLVICRIKGFWTRNRFPHGVLGYGGNSSSLCLINRACCFPPAACLVVTDVWRITFTDRCWQVSIFLRKNAQGRIPCKKLKYAFQVVRDEDTSVPLYSPSWFGHLLFSFLRGSLYQPPTYPKYQKYFFF